jgi:hypothetical protein
MTLCPPRHTSQLEQGIGLQLPQPAVKGRIPNDQAGGPDMMFTDQSARCGLGGLFQSCSSRA